MCQIEDERESRCHMQADVMWKRLRRRISRLADLDIKNYTRETWVRGGRLSKHSYNIERHQDADLVL